MWEIGKYLKTKYGWVYISFLNIDSCESVSQILQSLQSHLSMKKVMGKWHIAVWQVLAKIYLQTKYGVLSIIGVEK